MIFQQILLKIFLILNKERTVSSAYHLLRGKRSGQTIQDVGMFKLHEYFGLFPKLKRKAFDDTIQELVNQNQLIVHEDGYYTLGEMHTEISLPFLDGWHYRGNEHIYFSRLALIVETLSYTKHQITHFAPTEKNVEIQNFVRDYLARKPYKEDSFRKQLMQEIIESLNHPKLTDMQKEIVIARLNGMDTAGVTWQQLAQNYQCAEMDIVIYYISALHAMLHNVYNKNLKLLAELAYQVRIEIPLTDSAKQTQHLFNQGYRIEQIASMRRLKPNTIEDHLVEMAMYDVAFKMDVFLTVEQLNEITETVETYQTRKLRVLKEVLPDYTYFQLRLALARGETSDIN